MRVHNPVYNELYPQMKKLLLLLNSGLTTDASASVRYLAAKSFRLHPFESRNNVGSRSATTIIDTR